MNETVHIRRWLTCDCGKRHMTAYASIVSVCSCGRKIGARLWDDNAPQQSPEETP